MEIIFLGTGAAEGIPAFRCECFTCREARLKKGKHKRFNSSFYIKAGGASVLVDMPPQIATLLDSNGIDDNAMDSILLTHYHKDHTGGLYHLFGSRKTSGHVVKSPLPVYMPEDCCKTAFNERYYPDQPDLNMTDFSDYYSINMLKHTENVKIKDLEILALDSNHLSNHSVIPSRRECHGYLFSADGKTLAYMVDSSADLPLSTLEILEKTKLDCLVYECTFDRLPAGKSGHTDIEGVLRIKKNLDPERMIITHISHRNYGHDRLNSVMKEHGIEVAWDGLSVNI